MAEANGVIFYKSFYDAIKKIPKEYQLEIYNAIFEYSFTGKKPEELSDIAEAIFMLIKPNIDSSQKKYNASVENGKKGGRPPKNKNPEKTQEKPKQNPEETQKEPGQNLDKDKEKDKDKDKDIDKEKEINKEKEKTTANAVVEKKVDSNSSCSKNELQNIFNFYENNIDLLTEYSRDTLVDYAKDFPADLIILAMKKAIDSKVRTMKYIKGILNNWEKAGIKTVVQAQEEENVFRNKNIPATKEETEEEAIARKTRELEEALKNDKW